MKLNLSKLLATLAFAMAFAPAMLAHEGHDKAPGEDGETPGTGPIVITAEAKKNLALQVEEAELRTIEKTLLVIGQIEGIPNRSAAVSSRVPGRVTALKVTDGQLVKEGEMVVEVESRQLGDPPPRVSLAAPMGGIVMDRHVVIGDSVEPNQHLLEIGDLSEVYAEGHLFEGQIATVKPGQKVRVYVESYPKEVFTGTVDLVGGSLDPQTRTLKVWARVQNSDLKLRPKMRAQLSIVTAEADTVITVPHSAVLGEAGNLFVFVESDTDELVYERKPVVLGMKDDRYYEAIEGLFPGDKVVTLGNYQLQYVTTRKPAEPAAGASTNSVAVAEAEGQSHPAASAQQHRLSLPLTAMGVTVGVLLFLNLIALLVRRSKHEPGPQSEHVVPAAPAGASASAPAEVVNPGSN